MAKKRSGHGFWSVTPEGHPVHIKGDPNMPQETLDALLSMMDQAYKNATEVMSCGHTKDNLCRGDGERWFCGQCVLDEVEGKGMLP